MKLYSALLAPTSYFYTEVKVIKTVSEFGEYVFAGKPVLSPLLQFDDKMARTQEQHANSDRNLHHKNLSSSQEKKS